MTHSYDPVRMLHDELRHLRSLDSTDALQAFWEERYRQTYRTLLAERSEYGRYGVVAEYIFRTFPAGRVLDAGCGPGLLAGLLPHDTLSYTGIDISAEAIALARSHHPHLKDRFHNVSLDDYRQESAFDILAAVEILYYLNVEVFFEQCRRLLRPGGHLIITMYDFDRSRELLPQVLKHLHDPYRAEVYNAGKELRWHIVGGEMREEG